MAGAREIIGVIFVYGGLCTLAVATGAIFLHAVPRLRFATRRRGVAIAATGIVLLATGMTLPAVEQRVVTRAARIDDILPAWQFNEVHTLHVPAPPQRVWDAIHAVTADEIRFFRFLTTVRRFGRRGPESVLNVPERQPILAVATRTTFLTLAVEPPRELVLGTFVTAPKGFRRSDVDAAGFVGFGTPGAAKAVMNFLVRPDGRGGSHVSTETRVFATDAAATRAFARYWRIIYPGSAIIRRQWLRAIARRSATRGSR